MVFFGPFKHYYACQIAKFDNFLNGASTMLTCVFKGEWKSDIIVLLVNEGEQDRLNSENLSKIRQSVQELWII